MKRMFFGLAAALVLPAGIASAQAIVIGGGLAKDCYESTARNASNFVSTERICTRALEEETMTLSNRAATYVNRGILRMRNGQIDAALADYDRALSLNESLGAAYLNRGAALIIADDFAAALEALNQAIELGAQDLHAAYYNRAIAREQSGDVTGAYYDFLEAKELNPEWDLVDRQLSRFSVSNG